MKTLIDNVNMKDVAVNVLAGIAASAIAYLGLASCIAVFGVLAAAFGNVAAALLTLPAAFAFGGLTKDVYSLTKRGVAIAINRAPEFRSNLASKFGAAKSWVAERAAIRPHFTETVH